MRIQANLPAPVIYILDTLTQNGHEAFVVGGAVRDLLLKFEDVHDWDITTSATPEQILEIFPESFYDNNYGTVMIAPKHIGEQAGLDLEFEDLDVFDITTYRTEDGYTNRRHPDKVEWGKTLEEDVSRRDFTINAMALSSHEFRLADLDLDDSGFARIPMEIHDFHQGLADLDQGLIRTVGKAKDRFSEDALRMMRAVRIATGLNFQLEDDTAEAISSQASLLSQISQERIRDELITMLSSNYPAEGILLLEQLGLLVHILPELRQGQGIAQGGRHRFDVWKHSIESLRGCPSRDPIVRLATLLHDVGKPKTARKQGPRGVTFYGHEVVGAHMSKQISDRLRLSKKDKQRLFILIRWHMFTYSPEMTDSAIRRFIRRVGLENINDMMNLRIGDRQGGGSKATSWRLRELQQRIGENLYEPMSLKDIKIDGHRLMEILEIKPSPVLGKILNQLFELVMDDEVANEPEALEAKAREIYEETVNLS